MRQPVLRFMLFTTMCACGMPRALSSWYTLAISWPPKCLSAHERAISRSAGRSMSSLGSGESTKCLKGARACTARGGLGAEDRARDAPLVVPGVKPLTQRPTRQHRARHSSDLAGRVRVLDLPSPSNGECLCSVHARLSVSGLAWRALHERANADSPELRPEVAIDVPMAGVKGYGGS